MEKAVSRNIIVKDIWCHSLSLAIFSLIQTLFPQKDDSIHIDISEEITDVTIVRNDIMNSCISIPFGRNHFLRELSAELKVSEEVADSMIRMHCAKSNDQLAALQLSVVMDKISKKWLSQVTVILEGFKEKIYVPDSIFLIAGSDLVMFLKDKLEKQDFKIILVDNKKIRSPIILDDVIFRLELMFLDNLYKI